MKLFVAPTDFDWFNFHAARQPDEVNFWRPSAKVEFHSLDNGDPMESGHLFLFKLKGSINRIAGGGFFIGYSKLQLSVAWNIFGERNGATSFSEFSRLIRRYMGEGSADVVDPNIGCIVLTQPFFWAESQWLLPPLDWKNNIVQGKTYSSDNEIGKNLYDAVMKRLQVPTIAEPPVEGSRYGEPAIIHPRLGQGGFRYAVIERYQRRCAITGERSLPVLEAAHIKPYSEHGPHQVSNGLLLRADLHRLFDSGYMTITSDFHVEVSKHLKEDFENGREYYAMNGSSLIVLPTQLNDKPNREFVEWHNENRFRG